MNYWLKSKLNSTHKKWNGWDLKQSSIPIHPPLAIVLLGGFSFTTPPLFWRHVVLFVNGKVWLSWRTLVVYELWLINYRRLIVIKIIIVTLLFSASRITYISCLTPVDFLYFAHSRMYLKTTTHFFNVIELPSISVIASCNPLTGCYSPNERSSNSGQNSTLNLEEEINCNFVNKNMNAAGLP